MKTLKTATRSLLVANILVVLFHLLVPIVLYVNFTDNHIQAERPTTAEVITEQQVAPIASGDSGNGGGGS